jgi:predicted transcriptional regulator
MAKKDLVEPNEYMFFGIKSDTKNLLATMKFRRVEKGYSQRDLAKLTGVKQSAIARMEALKVIPRLDTIILISRALDLQLSFKRITTGWDKFEKDVNLVPKDK